MSDQATPQEKLFGLIKDGRYQEAVELLPQVHDINVLDPASGLNALHMASARCSVILLEALWARPDLDEVRKDARGQLASQLMWHVAGEEEFAVRLMAREREYAKAHGIVLWPKVRENDHPDSTLS